METELPQGSCHATDVRPEEPSIASGIARPITIYIRRYMQQAAICLTPGLHRMRWYSEEPDGVDARPVA